MFQIHHILPRSLAGHFTLTVLGNRFNLDGIKNLMDLPSNSKAAQELGSSPHTGGHLGSYNKIFCTFLGQLQSHPSFAAAQDGDAGAVDQLYAELSSFLATAKHALARGHLLTNTPLGMTPEDGNKQIEDWYAKWRTYREEHRDDIQQMQDIVDQLHAAGQWDGALRAPVLLPDSTLSLAEKIELLKQYPTNGPNRLHSPISQHFTAVGPVPNLPSLVPAAVDARLPGFIPLSPGDLNQPEGFTPSSPLLSNGLPGFSAINPQAFGHLPPSAAISEDPLVLKFDPATGWALPFSERSPILDPDPPSQGTPPASLYSGAALAALVAVAPQFSPLWARIGAAAFAAGAPTLATAGTGGGVFSTGAPPYDPFKRDQPANGDIAGATAGSWPPERTQIDQDTISAVNRDGNQSKTSTGMPAQGSQALEPEAARSAAAVASADFRGLARVNASNAGSVFTSGSVPIPYLPSTEFNERFGSWSVPSVEDRPPPVSKPIGAFADEPNYLIPPPIFGVDGQGNPHNDAEEWFSRWIRPFIRPE